MSQPDSQEVEAKFEVRNPTLAAYWMRAASLTAAFGLGKPVPVVHIDTYLDTVSYQLLRTGYSLRLRQTGQGFAVTLKALPTTGASPIHTRLEFEGPVADANDPLNVKGWPKPIRQLLLDLLGKTIKLRPLCILHQRRQKRAISTKARRETPTAVVAELSIDEVTLYAPYAHLVKLTEPDALNKAKPLTSFWEIEVELKPGQNVATLELLSARLGRDRGLQPNHTSKFERAMAIVNLHAPHTEQFVPFIQPTMHMAEACRLIWRQQLTQMVLKEVGARQVDGIESIHEMRVAVRRARVAARLFGDYFQARKIRSFVKKLKQTSRRLGAVRDLDVALERLERRQTDGPEDELAKQWRHERKQAHHALLTWLDSDEYSQFVAEFARFCQTPGKGARQFTFEPAQRPTPFQVRHVMPGMLVNRFERVRCFETRFETGDPLPAPTLHLLRIECKYLRYLLEFARHLLGPPGEQLIESLKQLQEHLGDLNDAAVSEAKLRAVDPKVDAKLVEQYASDQGELVTTLREEIVKDLPLFFSLANRHKLAQAIERI